MSYDIRLVHPVTKKTLLLDSPHFMRGGTYNLFGESEAQLNVTYNYASHYYRVFGQKGIRTLYGKSGAETTSLLKTAIDQLGDDVDDDYWKPTEGNAKAALFQLLALAQMRPDGIWEGD